MFFFYSDDHDLPSHALLQAVASDIPQKKWKFVFRTLMTGFPQASTEIENIESDNFKDLGEQKVQALRKWFDSNGNKATVLELDKALRQQSCSSVADKHTAPLLTTDEIRDSKGNYIRKMSKVNV